MAFLFRRRLAALPLFYDSMSGDLHVSIGTFDFTYNQILSHVIFDIRSTPFRLVFMKHGRGDVLILPVYTGFTLVIEGDALYSAFLNYFEIGRRGRGEYHISDFINQLNRQTPERYEINNEKRQIIYDYDPIDRKNDGIYPIGLKNWAVSNAIRRAQGLKDSGHRQDSNLEKTKNLYPSLYAVVRDMDISVCYGRAPNAATEFLQGGNLIFRIDH